MTTQGLHDLITNNETQHGASDRITGAEVRAVDNAIVDELATRGIIMTPNTSNLATISKAETGNVLVSGVGLFEPFATAIAPDGVNTFPSPDAGYVWKKNGDVAPPVPFIAGLDKQIIFNDGGVLAGDIGLRYDKTTKALSLGTINGGTLNIIGQNGNLPFAPAMMLKFPADVNPAFSVVANIHDGIAIGLDCYPDQTNTSGYYFSSSVNSNFALVKGAAKLNIWGATAQAIGTHISWSELLHFDYLGNIYHLTGGFVYGRQSPAAISCAAIEIDSIYKSLVLSRVTTTERNANVFPPVGGTMLYDKTVNKISYYNGTAWVYVADQNTGLNTQVIFNDNGALAGDAGLLYDKVTQNFYAGSNMGRIIITGTAASISAFPTLRLKFASDANAPLTLMAYSQDNLAVTFAMWHNGSNWISGSTAGNFMHIKQTDHIGYIAASGIAVGSPISTLADIWFINAAGHVNHPFGSYVFGRSSPIAQSCAAIEIDSISKWLLLPRPTTAQRDANVNTPVAGCVAYDATVNRVTYHNGTAWVYLPNSDNGIIYDATTGLLSLGQVGTPWVTGAPTNPQVKLTSDRMIDLNHFNLSFTESNTALNYAYFGAGLNALVGGDSSSIDALPTGKKNLYFYSDRKFQAGATLWPWTFSNRTIFYINGNVNMRVAENERSAHWMQTEFQNATGYPGGVITVAGSNPSNVVMVETAFTGAFAGSWVGNMSGLATRLKISGTGGVTGAQYRHIDVNTESFGRANTTVTDHIGIYINSMVIPNGVTTNPIAINQVGALDKNIFFGFMSIGGAPVTPSAQLEIVSTTKGFMLPKMTKTQRDGIASPATGLMIFQTDNLQGIYFYTGTAWLNSTPVQYTPVNGADPTGDVGQVAWDANYIYVKASTTWKRINLSNVP